MTATMARLVLAMLLLPASGAVFLVAFIVCHGPLAPTAGRLMLVWFIVYAFIAVYWISLWYNCVQWTIRRAFHTIAATGIALAMGVAIGVVCMSVNGRRPEEIAILIGGGTVPITWVLGTVIAWRETTAERAERLARLGATVVCPLCGYNLAGLRDTRCPECGSTFTLDQLAASQPRAAQAAEL
jgi:hypothetical protein